jgi:hypothetical protein
VENIALVKDTLGARNMTETGIDCKQYSGKKATFLYQQVAGPCFSIHTSQRFLKKADFLNNILSQNFFRIKRKVMTLEEI